MDIIDRKIIELLAQDSRQALAVIGAAAGLSASTVNERIRRLVAQGTIRRFTVEVDPQALDLAVLAFVGIALAQGADEGAFCRAMAADSAVGECHHVTGGWSYLIKVRVASLAELEGFLAGLKAQGYLARSETVVALSSAVPDCHAPRQATP